MFGLDVGVKCGIRQVPKSTSTTNKLSSLLVFSGFSDFFFFLVEILFGHVLIIFDLVIVKHIHFLLTFDVPDDFFVIDFGDRVEIILLFLSVVSIVA